MTEVEEKILAVINATRLLRKNLKKIQELSSLIFFFFFQVFSQQSGCVDNCENLFFYKMFHPLCVYMFHRS